MNPPDSQFNSSAGFALDAAAAAMDTPALLLLREELQAAVGAEYTVAECLGRGGMGAVFRANQETLDRNVAIKVMLPSESIPREDWIERFQREAKALAGLSHPGIVRVYSYGQTERLAWIVMESVDGTSLRQLMRQGQLTPAEALGLVPQICRAIQFAHDHGVVHRDIKPENVLVDSKGQVMLVDFGLALLKQGENGSRMTVTAEVLGTLRYMAPEQLDTPKNVDHRADIFSLGVVIYEMLTGKVPQGVIEPPSRRVKLDVRLDEVVLRTLEHEPERRYQAASDIACRMEEIEKDPRPSEQAVEPVQGTASPCVDRVAEVAARLTQHRTGRRYDAVIFLLTVGLFATAGQMPGAKYETTWVTVTGFGVALALGLPLFVGSLIEPESSNVSLPLLRLTSTVLAVGALLMGALAFPSTLLTWRADHFTWRVDAGLTPSSFTCALSILVFLPCVAAVLTSIYPIGFQWSPFATRVLVWMGVVSALVAVVSTIPPWAAERPLFRWVFIAGAALLAAMAARGSTQHAAYRVDKACALGMALAGPVGVILLLGTSPGRGQRELTAVAVALMASVATGFLGGLLGAGTRLRDLPQPAPATRS
ncbi:Serine/threonine-protein kinase PknB [Planctomycetes bacterium Poly30]|uniref:Serine/threonine-protein kinase PknB n=1 Tax=Saltatorellus ferox TaxID=2528018 RepID=A0A518ET97_9BACT|nr:Serine/threonine-protein kinase PknB [Planctomycetes bacterium Poly30]